MYEVWQSEVKKEVCLLNNAILNCIELDKKRGVEVNLDWYKTNTNTNG